MQKLTLETLSQMSQADFAAHLGDIFEHSPWVAQRAWTSRPFHSVNALHAAMVAAVDAASEDEQIALIRAHPELAGKEAKAWVSVPASINALRKNWRGCNGSTRPIRNASDFHSSSRSKGAIAIRSWTRSKNA